MMLDDLIISVLNMSLIASYAIVFVIVARLLLKKAPKIFSYALWAVVLFRLLCPLSFESAIGLLPKNTEPIPQNIVFSQQPQINTGILIIDNSINPILPVPPNIGESINPIQIWTGIGSYIWIIGIVFMLIFSVIQFLKLKKQLIGSTPLRDNIYLADHISSPFVMGLLRPKIYLPSSLSEREQGFIIAHENHHIKRFDHITRILAFAALAIHWFNPLVWVAFVLSGRDMELSCDEAVMGNMSTDIRGDYSQSLLRFATGRKLIVATPLAFGEGDTRGRVKNVMRYKKPMVWAFVGLIALVVSLLFMFGTNNIGFKMETMKEAQNMGGSHIAKIELLVSTYGDETYHLFDESDFPDIIALVTESSGSYVENPEEPDGGSTVCFYITKKDGNILRFATSQNQYLVINDDHFKADKNLLEKMSAYQATDPVPPDFHYGKFESEPATTPTETNAVSISELWKHRTEYVGYNSAVGGILNELSFPSEVQYSNFSLQTSRESFGLTIFVDIVSEPLSTYREDVNWSEFYANQLILFSLIGNLDEVRYHLYDGTEFIKAVYHRQTAEEEYGADLFEQTETLKGFESLLPQFFDSENSNLLADAEATDIIYSITKISHGGGVRAISSLEDQPLPEAIIMGSLVISSAFQGVDVATLDEYYIISQTVTKSNETSYYYAYRLEEVDAVLQFGTAVLQHGKNGMYNAISEELYLALEQSFDKLYHSVTAPKLTADMTIGTAVIIDYVDDEKIVFHGYFGLFIYDLIEEKLTFVADLTDAIGTNAVQGDVFADVLISGDGKTLMAYQNDSLANYETITALYVDLETTAHEWGAYEPFDSHYPATVSPLEGVTLGTLKYVANQKEFLLFAGYPFLG